MFSGQGLNGLLLAASRPQTAYCTHLLLAALFFSPFLLFGDILVARDLLAHNYPMLLLAKKNFLAGSLGLWNPYTFSGAPEAVAAGTPIFFPENWLLFLVPGAYLFSAITFVAFLKLWLIGVLAYRFFVAELLNRRWALFASVTYQLSGWLIWAVISYVALSILVYYTALLVVLWTENRRGRTANYLIMSALITMMLFAGNIAHGCYGLLGAGILYLYRIVSRHGAGAGPWRLAVFAASCATSLLVFCVRLFPIVDALASGTRNEGCPFSCTGNFRESTILLARFFNTEILGVNYQDSVELFTNISPFLKAYHLHWAMPAFFGITAALAVLWMLLSEKTSKTAFWALYTVAILGVLAFIQPFDVLALALLVPAYHPIGFELLLAVGFAASAALGAMNLERTLRRSALPRATVQLFIFALIMAGLLMLVVGIRNARFLWDVASLSARLLTAGVIGLLACMSLAPRLRPGFYSAGYGILWLVFAASLAHALLPVHWWDNPTGVSHLKNISAELALFSGVALVLALILRGRTAEARRLALWAGGGLAVVTLVVTLVPWTHALQLNLLRYQSVTLAGLGGVRFLIATAIFFLLAAAIVRKQLPHRSLWVFFSFLLLAEQVPGGKIHGFLSMNPFYSAGTPYPERAVPLDRQGRPIELDLSDYAVNSPNAMLQLPLYTELWGPANEVCTSINVAYGVRSYGGFNNTVPVRTEYFLHNWVPKAQADFCVYANVADERYLDLSGVGYAYDRQSGTTTRRPRALSRLMLFDSFDLIPDDESTLEHLKTTDFQPLKRIVLRESPGFESANGGADALRLRYADSGPDRIQVEVNGSTRSVLFFGDTFNPGWHATVNGQPEKVLLANYNFMAVAVPAGPSTVVLEYRPASFALGLRFAFVGLGVFCVVLLLYASRRTLRRRVVAA